VTSLLASARRCGGGRARAARAAEPRDAARGDQQERGADHVAEAAAPPQHRAHEGELAQVLERLERARVGRVPAAPRRGRGEQVLRQLGERDRAPRPPRRARAVRLRRSLARRRPTGTTPPTAVVAAATTSAVVEDRPSPTHRRSSTHARWLRHHRRPPVHLPACWAAPELRTPRAIRLRIGPWNLLRLEVANTGRLAREAGPGVWLRNVRARLRPLIHRDGTGCFPAEACSAVRPLRRRVARHRGP